MKLKIKLMVPVIVLFLLTILTLAYLTEIRETSHHMDRELEAWVDVGQSIVSAWSTTMILTGSDNLARDQLYQQDNKNILSISMVRNPNMKRINAQSSPFASTELQMEVIRTGMPTSSISQSDRIRSLLTLVPVVAKLQCVECHTTQNQHEIKIGDVMGVLSLKTSLELVDVQIASDRNSVLFGLAAALLIGVFFVYYSTDRIIKPIQILTALSKKVTSGNLDVRSDIASDDEIGVLSQTFNEMTAKLSDSRVELENHAALLETKIAVKAEEIRQSETTFRRLTEKTAKTTGGEFFESLVLSISDWLGCKWGLLGEVLNDEDVNVLARCENGKILEPVRFSLNGTPCEDLSDGRYRYHDHVKDVFPDDDLLREMKAETYVGIPFYSSTNEPIGILIAYHDRFLKPPPYAAEVFKVFANRAAAELERQRIEQEKDWLSDKLKEAERERTKRTLRKGETRYRDLIETTSDWIWEIDNKNVYTYTSPKVHDILGYEPEEVIGKTPFDFMPEDEALRIQTIFQEYIASGDSFERIKNINIHKNGSRVIMETSGVPILDDNKNPLGYRGIDRDITKRTKMEEDLLLSHSQLRELSFRLQNLLEKERARIARELHDELGMSLTAVKMDISWLRDNQSHNQRGELFRQVAQKLDATIESMRRIATELRPGILDAVGVAAAVEWQLEEFAKQTGITCDLVLPEEELRLDNDQSTAIFRIIQESLTNVIRHAEASELKVTITQTAAKLLLEVTDNGKGILETQLDNQKSLGILGMRERIVPWGGKLNIQANSATGSGTTVKVTLPLMNGGKS